MSALCPLHPESAATATCSRCGNFGCASCLPAGGSICSSCVKRFDGEPLDQAIRWVTRRVSALKMTVGVGSTLLGVGLGLSVVWFVVGGVVGGGLAAALVVITISLGRTISGLILRVWGPRLITQARERFGLHEEVLQELRLIVN